MNGYLICKNLDGERIRKGDNMFWASAVCEALWYAGAIILTLSLQMRKLEFRQIDKVSCGHVPRVYGEDLHWPLL